MMNIRLGGVVGCVRPGACVPPRVFENLLPVFSAARGWIGRSVAGRAHPIDFIYVALWQNNKEFSYVFLIYFDFLYSWGFFKKKKKNSACAFPVLDQTCLVFGTLELVPIAAQSGETGTSCRVSRAEKQGSALKMSIFNRRLGGQQPRDHSPPKPSLAIQLHPAVY